MISREKAPHYVWGERCESWHLLARPDLSVVHERLPPRASERRHQHPKSRQFLYVLRGSASLVMDGRTQVVGTGQGAEILPGSHYSLANEGNEDLEFLVISHPHRVGDDSGVEHARAKEPPVSFATREGYVCARVVGFMTVRSLTTALEQGMRECQSAGVKRFLIDIRNASHEPFTTAQRYEVASGIADFWQRDIKLAFVARPDQVDPERFAVLVAKNRGIDVSGHMSEDEAIQQLLKP